MTLREEMKARQEAEAQDRARRNARRDAYKAVASTTEGRMIMRDIVQEIFRRGFDKTANNAFAEGRRDMALQVFDLLRESANKEDLDKILYGE